jgi:porin
MQHSVTRGLSVPLDRPPCWLLAAAFQIACAMMSPGAYAQADVEQGAASAAAEPQGLVPIPDYAADIWSRSHLSGDWGGMRTDLANKGIQLEINWTQYLQGVVDGGRDETTRYGGTLDYLINFDLMRMGLIPGALVKLRAESRYGHSVNGASGIILPVNTDMLFPLTDELDEDVAFTITNLSYTQFLGEHLAFMIGKLDTLDGDPNEFASGRGTSQFMNANFIFNSALALRLPYSTLGGGVIWMPVPAGPDGGITISSLVMNTADSSTTTGFNDFGDGISWTTEANFQYRLGSLPGGMNVGFLYSFDQDFTAFSGELIFRPGEGLIFPTADDTWAAYWSGWQYLFSEEPADHAINLLNGQPDLQGVGLFARFGFADEDTNPIEWSLSGGVGGRGVIPSRDNDTFGVGYYYTSLRSNRLSSFVGLEDESHGFEAFYNLAITPAAHLTFDAQVVEPVSSDIDTAVILGMRVGLTF